MMANNVPDDLKKKKNQSSRFSYKDDVQELNDWDLGLVIAHDLFWLSKAGTNNIPMLYIRELFNSQRLKNNLLKP